MSIQNDKTKPPTRKRPASREDIEMRRTALYFVIGLCTISELASIIGFFTTGNIAAASVFQIPTLICLYRILCYLYPTDEPTGSHPLVAFLQSLLGHKP